jgi:phenylpyruvate tautomerase PptA (4-oxalocrotonate tautomerase family)
MNNVIIDTALFLSNEVQSMFSFFKEISMPNIFVKVPQGAFTAQQRQTLAQKINQAAATTEQMPDDMQKRFVNWIIVDEVAQGMFTCGGLDMTEQVLPCSVMAYVPSGVLNGASRASYVKAIHAAFAAILDSGEKRQLATSVILHEVPEGQWGANGMIWRLPDFAKAAGYAHLQSLVA